jgi:hypothetical protein
MAAVLILISRTGWPQHHRRKENRTRGLKEGSYTAASADLQARAVAIIGSHGSIADRRRVFNDTFIDSWSTVDDQLLHGGGAYTSTSTV